MSTYHIYPTHDLIEHNIDTDASDELQCQCNPEVRWIDPETATPLAWPLIIHNALDGRE